MRFEAVTFTCFMITLLCLIGSILTIFVYPSVESVILATASALWLSLQWDWIL
jgi:uncharacterized MnhB-related membrane protein